MQDIVKIEHEMWSNINSSRSANTARAYNTAWQSFACQYGAKLPSSPEDVALYLSELGMRSAPSTVRVHASAIADAHKNAGHESPTNHPGVQKVISGHSRRALHVPTQASGIDTHAFELIVATAQDPRPGIAGRMETFNQAQDRGLQDICMIGLMRDALLRRGECADLVWSDLSACQDGSGRLLIRKSKTDQDGRGCVRYVSEGVMCVLNSWRIISGDDRIIDLSGSQICRRIQSACQQAGLDGHYSGHSPRIGMAIDLARAGVSLPALMEAGRWKSSTMPAHYVRAVEAGSGAVAQWYQQIDEESE